MAAKLGKNDKAGRRSSLVVIAEGATPIAGGASLTGDYRDAQGQSMRKSLSPLSDPRFGEGAKVIERSGVAAETVALKLQKLTDEETFPMAIGHLVRGGTPTAVDRQLGLGYGAGAVRALNSGQNGVMVVFQPPELRFVSLAQSINKVRTVPADSEFIQIARALGISLGD